MKKHFFPTMALSIGLLALPLSGLAEYWGPCGDPSTQTAQAFCDCFAPLALEGCKKNSPAPKSCNYLQVVLPHKLRRRVTVI